VHASNLLQPWIAFRLVAGLVAAGLFVRGAWTSSRVLRYFDVTRASEGQLALERQAELAAAFVRVATVVQVALLALSMLASDRLSGGIRGAMCGYGVFSASAWGFRALVVTVLVAVLAGVLAQLYAFDARVRGMDLVRPLAIATVALAPFAVADFAINTLFALDLDLSVVASCCSVQLDAVAAGAASNGVYASGPRVLTTIAAPIAIALSVAVALFAARRPRAPIVILAGALSACAFPLALGASIFEVAPHAFEIPQHVCPFCLLKASVYWIGYPLFGTILLAVVWSGGAAAGALLARGEAARRAFADFARERLRREAFAWTLAFLIGAVPIARYAIVAGGASLFP
jgi:hypothetical protein